MSAFVAGQIVRVDTSHRDGYYVSTEVGTVDGTTPRGMVRVRLYHTDTIRPFAAARVTVMSDAEIARWRWGLARPRTSYVAVSSRDGSLGTRADVRPGYVQTRARVDVDKLSAMRDEITALIAWLAAEPSS